jgi:hypothetical protein
MLPPGLLSALRGQPNEIVVVTVFAIATGSMAAGAPAWPVVALGTVSLFVFHIRCTSTERHNEVMAHQRVEEAVARANAVKARHRGKLLPEQPGLPLEQPGRLTGDGTREAPRQ